MKALLKRAKFDIGVAPQALNNTNATGAYFSMTYYRKVLAVLSAGAMAAGKTAKIELLQAKDANGTEAKALTGAEVTVTANTSIAAATLTLATVAAGNAITINGLTFTAHATETTPEERKFSIDGDDSADAAALAGLINHAIYGVPGIIAVANAAVITLTAIEKGITITDAAAAITPATVRAVAYVEADVSHLDINNDYTHVAVKLTTTANTVAAATLIRGDGRFEPEQVGPQTVL
ncbi:hypothetical protein M7775_19150 [Sporomusa sphaeroides DSM 2875]|uniref:hypothetical protein n=1 Tax=Sporomusa sphaeroides TaxID=47679 RepID=UPI00203048F7|nr:hypothetical protein [Sporomusa sphaeroides]MCM0760671.1 hypothetical protein [Sporomusa sphaeroides DSM 2875]